MRLAAKHWERGPWFVTDAVACQRNVNCLDCVLNVNCLDCVLNVNCLDCVLKRPQSTGWGAETHDGTHGLPRR